ncbi:hypothetical protein QE152_g10461 [Popillia japonica]|uniref:Uncharacterized protein n=1 Tax=Popillia japonica TaxID=7064 RepID=A0AAW1LUH9_POPJA
MAPSRKAQRILEFILLRRQRKRRAQYWIHPLNIERLEYDQFDKLHNTLEDVIVWDDFVWPQLKVLRSCPAKQNQLTTISLHPATHRTASSGHHFLHEQSYQIPRYLAGYKTYLLRTDKQGEKTTTALLGPMPNIDGPIASKRKLFMSVVQSQIPHAAPVCYKAMSNQKPLRMIGRPQRTISGAGKAIIAGVARIEFMVEERHERFNGKTKTAAAAESYKKWQTKWTQYTYGRWSHRLIPDIRTWVHRP